LIFTVLSSEHCRTLLAPAFGGTLYISEYMLRTSELQETLGLLRAVSPRADCEEMSQD
jgi:hypothetical protein